MEFIEIEKSIRQDNWNMLELHSHNHYEIYFLMEGTRNFFLSNAYYFVKAPSIIIIPPNTLHKTEGNAFTRFNINVSPLYLDSYQKKLIKAKQLQVMGLTNNEQADFTKILQQMVDLDKYNTDYDYLIKTMFDYLIYQISFLSDISDNPTTKTAQNMHPQMLKIINYLQTQYMNQITLDDISEKFYISKGALVYNFKKYTNYNPIDFLVNVRILKAQELLIKTKYSLSIIAEKCGFSSANYFSLIFKKREGLSPQNYRKVQLTKV